MRRDAIALSFFGALALAWTGCNAILGIEPIQQTAEDDAGDAGVDASTDGVVLDSLAADSIDSGNDSPDTLSSDTYSPETDAPGPDTASGVDAPSLDADGADGADGDVAVDTGNDTADTLCAQLPISLGSASRFVVLAASTVTSTGATALTGDLGLSPGTAVTGFPPGTLSGSLEAGNPVAATAMADFGAAYAEAKARSACAISPIGDLGGRTLTPGLYRSVTSMAISTGDLTLDAQGDGHAVFVFQMATTLNLTAGRRVVLTNGAKSGNVFWQVGTSATLATMSSFQGTVLADQSITMDTGATLNGRVFARAAAVTLVADTIVLPSP
jgi:hypothetical protein